MRHGRALVEGLGEVLLLVGWKPVYVVEVRLSRWVRILMLEVAGLERRLLVCLIRDTMRIRCLTSPCCRTRVLLFVFFVFLFWVKVVAAV